MNDKGDLGMAQDSTGTAQQFPATSALSDPILEAVRKYNAQYNNTGYSKQPSINMGKGKFYTVTFKGEDNESYANFVYDEKGKGQVVYSDLRSLINDKGGRLFPVWDIEWLRPIGIFVVVLLLLLVSAAFAYSNAEGKAFTAFMSAFTAALGYLAGKDTANGSSVPKS